MKKSFCCLNKSPLFAMERFPIFLINQYSTDKPNFFLRTCLVIFRADVSKYRPEVYKSEKSKILKKIHKVALGKLLK